MKESELLKDTDAIYFCVECDCDDPCKVVTDQESSTPEGCFYPSESNCPNWQLVERD